MTDSTWRRTQALFDENQRRFSEMEPDLPKPGAKFCRESAHRTLGHLTACQAAWLSLMRGLRDGAARGVVPINPDPLYRQLGFGSLAWGVLFDRFVSERDEWRQILSRIEPTREIRTRKRVYSAQTLTRRLVEHEKRHLDDLSTE